MNTFLGNSENRIESGVTHRTDIGKILLVCGILAALLYVSSDILAALSYEGYSLSDHSVSELRAIGAPTRPYLVPVLVVFGSLEFLFGVGIWRAAGQERSRRTLGCLLIGLGILDLAAILFPMHVRGMEPSVTDTLHIVVTFLDIFFMLLVLSSGILAGRGWVRFFSIAILIVFLATSALAIRDGPRIIANLPTPWIGIRERTGIYSYMLWLAVMSVVQVRGWRAGGDALSVGTSLRQGRHR